MFGFTNVAAITIICYLVGEAVKAFSIDSKFIPVICGAFGGVLGVLAFYLGMPEFPAVDVITALAVGIVSGFAATGIDQSIKKLSKSKKSKE